MEETAVQALTKVIALMPPRLRRRMDALKSQTEAPGPWAGAPVVDAGVLTTLAQACRDDEPLKFDYTARESETTHRWVEPHRLVALGRRWYLVAYDRDRQDWRSFRVDRIGKANSTGQRFRPRELPAKDALSFVQAGIRRMPQRYAVRVRFEAPVEVVDAFVGRWAQVEPDGDAACVMTMNTDTLDWPMFVLANIDAEFRIEGPTELVEAVARAAARFGRCGA
jgi:predicted DNA-binding transcriptional regulator YafY